MLATAPADPRADDFATLVSKARAARTAHAAIAEPEDASGTMSFLGVASDGVEYRVGLVNTPELSACGGPEAADRTYALLADGFTVEAYSSDNYGRSVARVRTADGTDLGVWLARNGWADDRYLDDFADSIQTLRGTDPRD